MCMTNSKNSDVAMEPEYFPTITANDTVKRFCDLVMVKIHITTVLTVKRKRQSVE